MLRENIKKRELAFQLSEQFIIFGKPIGIKTAVIVGGQDRTEQASLLVQSPHVVVGTPGRVCFHLMNTPGISLRKLRFLVLDEADSLLRSSFSADLGNIFLQLPIKRQTILFSATVSDTLKKLFENSNKDVFTWKISMDPIEGLFQAYVLTPAQVKSCYFIVVLQTLLRTGPQSMIVFTNTCRSCHLYSELLQRHDIHCVSLHSLLTQVRTSK
jgi:ATP-dependent RNA helicase DDX49/DBP8